MYFYDRCISFKYKNMKTHQNLMLCVIINVLRPWKSCKIENPKGRWGRWRRNDDNVSYIWTEFFHSSLKAKKKLKRRKNKWIEGRTQILTLNKDYVTTRLLRLIVYCQANWLIMHDIFIKIKIKLKTKPWLVSDYFPINC